MYIYHEQLLNNTRINQSQFSESYKANHILTTFPPAPSVASTFVQDALLDAQRRFKLDQYEANNGNIFGTQEEIHQPQLVTSN